MIIQTLYYNLPLESVLSVKTMNFPMSRHFVQRLTLAVKLITVRWRYLLRPSKNEYINLQYVANFESFKFKYMMMLLNLNIWSAETMKSSYFKKKTIWKAAQFKFSTTSLKSGGILFDARIKMKLWPINYVNRQLHFLIWTICSSKYKRQLYYRFFARHN